MVNRYARKKETPEEIQEKMKALYPKYEQLQRDGSVSMSANEAQDLLSIHKHLFNGQNFCTTCPPAILKAVEVCFRNYRNEFISEGVKEELMDLGKQFDELLVDSIGLPMKFIGTKKQAKEIKAQFPEFNKNETIGSKSEILTDRFKDWFKEV